LSSDALPVSVARRRARLAAGLLAAAVTVGCLGQAPPSAQAVEAAGGGAAGGQSDVLELRFLDVGQGAAVLIRAPDGRAVLYDGGQDGARLMAELERAGVTSLELVIASHNHADHIGGLVAAVERYRPRYVMENGVPHTTRTYERFLRAVAGAGSQRLEPTRRTITLGDVRLRVIPPPGDPALGHNDNSVGLRVEYGAFAATLMGDSQPAQQRWWLAGHGDLLGPVSVHKASHHGSRNGDTRALLDRLRPGVVVISVGRDNRYGHPHESALALYRDVGADVFRTDVHGTVTIRAGLDGMASVEVGEDPAPISERRP
jgi:competence protein ComEC